MLKHLRQRLPEGRLSLACKHNALNAKLSHLSQSFFKAIFIKAPVFISHIIKRTEYAPVVAYPYWRNLHIDGVNRLSLSPIVMCLQPFINPIGMIYQFMTVNIVYICHIS